jgi:mono/diheme cytochrome c family protein
LPGLEANQPLVDLGGRQQHPQTDGSDDAEPSDGEQRAEYDDQLSFVVEDIFFDVVQRWETRTPTTVPEPPAAIFTEGAELTALVERGRTLFVGKANCAQCHGQTGLGDGQTENYDDWTSQWVKGANIDPLDPQAYAPFVAAGALPPRAIRPRNLRFRVYRGGDQVADLYRRIANGIEGTGMPDASALSEEEVWALVAFVMNLPYETVGAEGIHALPNGPQTQ